ncbi:MAG: hypothetical protein AAB495_02355 [Patescibacteria group bacterium]
MKMKTMIVRIFLLVSCFALLSGCSSYQTRFEEKAKAKGWTEDEVKAAIAYADRVYFSSEKDGKFTPRYGMLGIEKIREQLEKIRSDVSGILGYENRELAKYIDYYHLRSDLERQEQIAQVVYARVLAAELKGQFKKLMGLSSEGEKFGYNPIEILSPKASVSANDFKSAQIDAARESGTLKQVEFTSYRVERKFDRKIKDPDNPEDPNAFLWASKFVDLQITGYKIFTEDRPSSNESDYIEGVRVVDGKAESQPALRMYFPTSDRVAVVVIDGDQGNEPGFGLPDSVMQLHGMKSVEDVLRNKDILEKLFPIRDKQLRIPPKPKDFRVEIVRVGETLNVWEEAKDSGGWKVPFQYRNGQEDNYNLSIAPEPAGKGEDARFVRLGYVGKAWTGRDRYTPSAGAVVEYYRPHKEFAGSMQAIEAFLGGDPKKISFVFPDGTETNGYILPGTSKFVEDEPFAIAYTEGDRRWWIEKSEGSTVFDKRKQVSPSERPKHH